jgi:heme A synthase
MTDGAAQAAHATTTHDALTGWRAGVDRVYRYLIGLYVVALVLLVYLAGEGIFGEHATKIADAKSLDPHRGLGSVLGLVAVVLFLLALAARVNRATVIQTLVLALLALVAQPALAGGGESNKWVGGFHVVDGVAIFALAVWLAYSAGRRSRST